MSRDNTNRDNPGRPTMHDVARAVGVSAMTVSRVFNNPSRVSVATRDKVEAMARQMSYVPDQLAGALASGESKLVAALLSTLSGSVFTSTVAGLNAELRDAGHQLLLGTTDYSQESEQALAIAALSRRPDGLVLTSGAHTTASKSILANAGIPVVELWELPARPIDMAVGFSNRAAGRAMTNFLFQLGYRRIAYIGGSGKKDRRGEARKRGYIDALKDCGLGSPREVYDTKWPAALLATPIEMGARGLSILTERWPDTDAVFCSSDAVALGVVMEASRCSMAIPTDLAVAGFGDFEYANDHGLGLTTLAIPGERMGREAAGLILARKRGEPAHHTIIDVGFEPIRRATA